MDFDSPLTTKKVVIPGISKKDGYRVRRLLQKRGHSPISLLVNPNNPTELHAFEVPAISIYALTQILTELRLATFEKQQNTNPLKTIDPTTYFLEELPC